MFGRHGEAPVPIVAAKTPSHCFDAAIEAARIALKYRTPVYLLSDGYLANGSEPWKLPDVESLPDISVEFATEPNATDAEGQPTFWPYVRDPESLARPWAIPGTPGLEHRIGGLEKQDGIGTVSLRAGEPRGDGADPRGEDRRHRKGPCARRGRRPDRRREGAAARLGLDLRGDHRRSQTGPQARQARRPSSPRAPEPVPAEPRRGAPLATRRSSSRRPTSVISPGSCASDFLVDAKVLSRVQGAPFRVGEIEQAILEEIERLEPGADGTPGAATSAEAAPAPRTASLLERPHDDRRRGSLDQSEGLGE